MWNGRTLSLCLPCVSVDELNIFPLCLVSCHRIFEQLHTHHHRSKRGTASLDFIGEWIRGDDTETTVFAQGYGNDRTVIFSFGSATSKPPTPLANRICNSFHAIEVSEAKSFPSLTDMRASLWNVVRTVWPACLRGDSIYRMDTVIDVGSQDSTTEQVIWKAYSHPSSSRFLEILADPFFIFALLRS